MNRACWTAVLTVGLLALSVPGGVPAAEYGPDFDPANPPPGFWDTNGYMVRFPKIDQYGNFQLFSTMAYDATTGLYDNHNKDSGGTKRPHMHMRTDYDSIAHANNYFDKRFGKSDTPPKTTRVSDATNQRNCYAYALATFIGTGTYKYWMQQKYGAADGAMNADTTPRPKTTVMDNDVLYYKTSNDHATGVPKTQPGQGSGGRTPTKLRWKSGGGGVYEYDTNGFNTPKYVGPDPSPGSPPSGWTWSGSGAGSELNLDPSTSVRRKNGT